MAKQTFPRIPAFSPDGVTAFQKGNLETAIQAQKVLVDAAQAIAKLNADYFKGVAQLAQPYYAKSDASAAASRRPEAVLADVRAAAERALAVAREGLDVGVRAQGEVVDLLAKRVVANMDGVKALVAPAAA